MRLKKKAGLDVSVNSIVVVIFAITMLGLGLTFIKTYFDKMNQQAGGVFEINNEPPEATPSDPIQLADPLSVGRGAVKFKVNFYNNQQNDAEKARLKIGECMNEDGDTVQEDDGSPDASVGSVSYFKVTSLSQRIPVTQQKKFEATLTVAKSTPLKKYICILKVVDEKVVDGDTVFVELETKQFSIEVK